MGTLKESQAQAVLEKVANTEAGTYEWWTALAFEDADLAPEPDPMVADDFGDDALELRLYSL
jgi:hypothetical protein